MAQQTNNSIEQGMKAAFDYFDKVSSFAKSQPVKQTADHIGDTNKMVTAVEWLVEQLEEQIRKSAHNELGTTRTEDYRIGLRKAIDFCEQAKQIERKQIMKAVYDGMGTNFDPNMGRAELYYQETYQTVNIFQ